MISIKNEILFPNLPLCVLFKHQTFVNWEIILTLPYRSIMNNKEFKKFLKTCTLVETSFIWMFKSMR